MRIAYATIAITLVSLSLCLFDETYNVRELQVIAKNLVESYIKNFPHDHRFEKLRLEINELTRASLIRQIEKMRLIDPISLYYIDKPHIYHSLQTFSKNNLAEIALYYDEKKKNTLFSRRFNLRDNEISLYDRIVNGMNREELITSIIKDGGDNLTLKELDNSLAKSNYTDVRARLRNQEQYQLIDVDKGIQQYYFGQIVINVDFLQKEELLSHIYAYLDAFPELEEIGVLDYVFRPMIPDAPVITN